MSELRSEAGLESISGFQPRRGRPTKEQVAAIERSILDVGRQLFLSEGYANTAMDAIATSAGVSKGTLYARYPDKPALFRAIVSEMLARSRDLVTDDKVFGRGAAPEQLYRFGTLFLERMLTVEAIAFDKLIIAEAENFPELAIEFHEQGYVKAVRRLADRVAANTREEGWPSSDPFTVATAFIAALIGWVRREGRIRELSPDDCNAFVGRLVALLMGGRSAW
jgi:TetR/AcrR family transcriptional repressor of mexJK operon